MLTTILILWIADPDQEFVVCTNACFEGLGGVFLQKNTVVSYEYLKLKKHEQDYVIYYMELATIVHALRMWRHYLLGKKFVLVTDQISLKYSFS